MCKNSCFAIGAFGFALAVILLATSIADPTSADVIRAKPGTHVAAVAAFLPAKALEPAW